MREFAYSCPAARCVDIGHIWSNKVPAVYSREYLTLYICKIYTSMDEKSSCWLTYEVCVYPHASVTMTEACRTSGVCGGRASTPPPHRGGRFTASMRWKCSCKTTTTLVYTQHRRWICQLDYTCMCVCVRSYTEPGFDDRSSRSPTRQPLPVRRVASQTTTGVRFSNIQSKHQQAHFEVGRLESSRLGVLSRVGSHRHIIYRADTTI
jgi:hypothetical protein